jgi:hypothetical protein
MEVACPKPTALTTVEKLTCNENFGQIQRLLIQRAGFTFTAPASDIALLASWTPLFIAVGDTKVISTPYLENFIIPRAEKISEGGGDNTTIDGREITLGAGAITASGVFAGVPAAIVKQLKAILLEADGSLVAYPINQYGKIIGIALDPLNPGDEVTGIPIYSPWVSDMGNDGLNTRDKGDFSIALDYGWRDDIVIITPTDFNAKTALWPPVV